MWGTDVMPEYKLMVKNDAFLENNVNDYIKELEGNKDEEVDGSYKPSLYFDKN